MPLGEEVSIDIDGMTCASCVAHVEKAAKSVAGVTDARVNLASGKASVQFDPAETDPRHIADAITHSGYNATPQDPTIAASEAEEHRHQLHRHEERGWYTRALVGILLWLPLEATHWLMQILGGHSMAAAQSTWMGWASLVAGTIAIIYVGGRFYQQRH